MRNLNMLIIRNIYCNFLDVGKMWGKKIEKPSLNALYESFWYPEAGSGMSVHIRYGKPITNKSLLCHFATLSPFWDDCQPSVAKCSCMENIFCIFAARFESPGIFPSGSRQ